MIRLAILVASLVAIPAGATVEVVYLGNEGIAISDGRHRIVVDALFGDGLAGYPAVPPETRSRLERGESEFADVALVLTTHHHGDHFDPAAVARHLAANPRARFISTPQAVSRLITLPEGSAIASRLRAVLPDENASELLRFDDLRITVYNLHHGRYRQPPVENLGFLIEIGGNRLLVVGDAEASFDEISRLGLAAHGIDLALLPYWLLERDQGPAGIRRVIAPHQLALIHLPQSDAPPDWFGAQVDLEGTLSFLRARWPGVTVLQRAGERLVVGGSRANQR